MPLKKHTNLDALAQERLGKVDLDKIVNEIEAFEDQQQHYINRVFMPAQREMYESIDKEITKILGGAEGAGGRADEASLFGKHKEIMQAKVVGLKAFFKRTKPSILAGLDKDMSLEDEDAFLSAQYDAMHDSDERHRHPLMSGLQHQYAQRKDAKVGHLLAELQKNQFDHAMKAYQTEFGQHSSYHLRGTTPEMWREHVKGKISTHGGFEIDNPAQFNRLSIIDYLAVHRGLRKGEWGADYRGNKKGIENYFLAVKEKKKA